MGKHIKAWLLARLKAWFLSRRREWSAAAARAKLWTLFFCLVGFGAFIGYGYGRTQTRVAIANITQSKNEEINRLQATNLAILNTLQVKVAETASKTAQASDQLSETAAQTSQAVKQLDQVTDMVTQAGRRANQAAQAAQGAAINAARANIRPGPTPPPPKIHD